MHAKARAKASSRARWTMSRLACLPTITSPGMTVFLPLESHTPLPTTPPFLSQPANTDAHLHKVIQAILKARRIVVVCGAGISVQAGIPDFRSPEGLFQTLKRDNPRENLASGKDLFDASVFNTEHTTSLFCQMIAQLSRLSQDAEPTSFHRVLRALDDRGKLLRVYTQNIDAIEQKTGLSFGVPEFDDRRGKNRAKGKALATQPPTGDIPIDQPPDPGSSTSRHSSPPVEIPRCIPLHGTLQSVHCQTCTHSFPLQEHLPSLTIGQPPQCPECTSLERTRQLIGKRRRGIGKLRPSVVLYNEAHKDGEGVGDVVSKDLMGSKGRSGADLLLVVGTSLRVPGTKRIVREFSKAVRSRVSSKDEGTASALSTDEESSIKAVYLNLDFPVPTREWEGVFDVWLQGDAQTFARMLQEEIEKRARARDLAVEKKKKRDEEAAVAAANAFEDSSSSSSSSSSPLITPKPGKRRVDCDSASSKRRKLILPLSPESPALTRKRQDKDVLPDLMTSSPLMIRIPSRRHSCYVDVPPVRLPPTPEDTPPSRYKRPFSGSSLPASELGSLTCSILEIGLSEDELDCYDALPVSCLRSTLVDN
ncbi:hypothetical protein Agabi119p4_5495 [Agaricus bisporus var. burnettii]|uniref:Deacetylase sirtuin-type domain-containing protein n=1 Tax=Agaricus bisporus var. burnettii TaxID=192524 RepID=A0A8H7F1T0_AGABI|nr:hypothetical protein Agabi119p4_5495 [Agaricus bisporus var. burnettii]